MAGSKLARTANSTPATATTASDSAMASPKMWRLSSPMSCATAGSSEVARNARPSAVRYSTNCSAAMTATATANDRSGNSPMEMPPNQAKLAVSMALAVPAILLVFPVWVVLVSVVVLRRAGSPRG